ncbi:MAG: esterase [Lachnospiraceae bacterium]|nr:esterase [Lachnospiraceae bacterium]
MGVIRYHFLSDVLGEQVNVLVIMPSFEAWKNHEGYKKYYGDYKKVKTLYLLHGGSDDSSLYLRRTRIEEYAMEYDMAVVMPEVKNSFYCNMVKGNDYFTYLSEELPRVMENVFSLSNDPSDRYVMGNSMGSHGAFKWALNRPDFFEAAAGMSGAGDLIELGFYDGMKTRVLNAFGNVDEYRGSMNDFKYLIDKNIKNDVKMPRMYSCCGIQDPFYKGAKEFAEYACSKGINIPFYESDGGHTWEYWDRMLPIMLKHMVKGE